MKTIKIALISDNHSYVGPDIEEHINDVDQIWHAGDIGELDSLAPLLKYADIIGVYGNIDDAKTRAVYPLNQIWTCNGVKVLMTHIGNYPGKYTARVKKLIQDEKPNLYICGHSHICKVMYDKDHELLHMNPGAYGHHGFHKIRTLLKFEITEGKIENLRVVELGLRGIESDSKTIERKKSKQ